MERLPYLMLSEILYAAYFSYYLMIVGVGLALYLRDRGQFFHYVSVVSFVFYVCYVLYIFLPVMGPRVFFVNLKSIVCRDVQPAAAPRLSGRRSGPGRSTKSWRSSTAILRRRERLFPAVTWRWPSARSTFPHGIFVPSGICMASLVILLCLSTIYCRYHYVVDVLAGLAPDGGRAPSLWATPLYAKFGRSDRQPPCESKAHKPSGTKA